MKKYFRDSSTERIFKTRYIYIYIYMCVCVCVCVCVLLSNHFAYNYLNSLACLCNTCVSVEM